METQMIFNIAISSMLVIVMLTLFVRKRGLTSAELTELLNRYSEEQRKTVDKQINTAANEQFQRFGIIQDSMQQTLQTSREEVNCQLQELREQVDARIYAMQKITADGNEKINLNVNSTLQANRVETNDQLGKSSAQLDNRLGNMQKHIQETLYLNREELSAKIREMQEQIDNRLTVIQRSNSEYLDKVNFTLESKMCSLQASNERRLEQMQGIVDEKLQKTLETRLSQSFALVNNQLETVAQGLGEMKSLAADAKSLKNTLNNVREHGSYGEVRLEKLLADIMAPNQYAKNVEISPTNIVEFVVKLPGNSGHTVLLPIDSKFPLDDYNKLLEANDKVAIEEARIALANKIREFAKDIHDKYVTPPKTTDFALMFLPTEGLYAEVIQNPALFEELRVKYKVTVVGITTLAAFLSSLQIGFRTLAIEQRSKEVWNTLRVVKSEFNKFGDLLDKAHKQIQTADKTLEEIVGKRTKAINKKLRNVPELSEADRTLFLDDK